MYIGEKELKELNSEYKIIKRFAGGMSNYTYLIEDENHKQYVYRFPGEGNEIFVNFEDEKYNLEQVSKLNMGEGKLLVYNIKNGIKINEYITGENIDEYVYLPDLVDVLKKLHTSEIKLAHDYRHLERLEKYEKLHTNKNMKKYYTLKNKWLDIFDKYLKMHIKYPAHCDSQKSNIIESTERDIRLLDWEFSAMNDYIYDIAAYGNNNFNDAEELLTKYEPIVDNIHYIRLYGWRIFQALQWFNVASIKHENNLSEKLNIDFSVISENYLLEAEKLLEKIKIYEEL